METIETTQAQNQAQSSKLEELVLLTTDQLIQFMQNQYQVSQKVLSEFKQDKIDGFVFFSCIDESDIKRLCGNEKQQIELLLKIKNEFQNQTNDNQNNTDLFGALKQIDPSFCPYQQKNTFKPVIYSQLVEHPQQIWTESFKKFRQDLIETQKQYIQYENDYVVMSKADYNSIHFARGSNQLSGKVVSETLWLVRTDTQERLRMAANDIPYAEPGLFIPMHFLDPYCFYDHNIDVIVSTHHVTLMAREFCCFKVFMPVKTPIKLGVEHTELRLTFYNGSTISFKYLGKPNQTTIRLSYQVDDQKEEFVELVQEEGLDNIIQNNKYSRDMMWNDFDEFDGMGMGRIGGGGFSRFGGGQRQQQMQQPMQQVKKEKGTAPDMLELRLAKRYQYSDFKIEAKQKGNNDFPNYGCIQLCFNTKNNEHVSVNTHNLEPNKYQLLRLLTQEGRGEFYRTSMPIFNRFYVMDQQNNLIREFKFDFTYEILDDMDIEPRPSEEDDFDLTKTRPRKS